MSNIDTKDMSPQTQELIRILERLTGQVYLMNRVGREIDKQQIDVFVIQAAIDISALEKKRLQGLLK